MQIQTDQCFWPMTPGYNDHPELVFLFERRGGMPLYLASNYPYELWVDSTLIGDGGHRSIPGECLLDQWDEAAVAQTVCVRLHWLNPNKTSVWYRCLFEDPFLFDSAGPDGWTCRVDDSVRFGGKVSSQLPRQNVIVRGAGLDTPIPLEPVDRRAWKLREGVLQRSRYVEVALTQPIRRLIRGTERGGFRPEAAEDVALYIRGRPACDLYCDTYDLGRIALHRFELSTPERGAAVLYYSEVSKFEDGWATRNRAKVRLADAVSADIRGASPFGTRGCRYVHLLYPADCGGTPEPKAWRREYPLKWKRIIVPTAHENLIGACKSNLVACVDGGIVDTCWRERTQWTGDVRMASLGLRALADNPEVIDLALHQIAQSYDPEVGMVKGAWPVKHPDYHGAATRMPTYHLAFCLASLEQSGLLGRDPLVREAVLHSVHFWKENYLREGILLGVPGWYFTDWDPADELAQGRNLSPNVPHAVCNAWWSEVCEMLDPSCCIAPADFDNRFWTGSAYALTPERARESIQATAAAVCAGLAQNHFDESLSYLEGEIQSGALTKRVTPYFAFFVAKALARHSQQRALEFIERFYSPIAQTWGTIYEKTSPDSSLAHSWSVAIASLYSTIEVDAGPQTQSVQRA